MRNIYQGDEEGCGLACLRMLLVCLSHKKDYRYLTLDGHPPYSLKALTEAGEKEGLELTFKRVKDKELLFKNDNWPILILQGDERNSHMVLLRRKFGSYVEVFDPSEGKCWKKISNLITYWNGIYGEVTSYVKTKCEARKRRQGGEIERVAALGFGLLSQAALYAGFYFVDYQGNFLYTIILFSTALVFEILKRLFAVRAMKCFDKKWLHGIYDDEKRLRKNYEHYYAYKKGWFLNHLSLFSSFLFFVSLSLLLGVNNLAFLASIGGLACYLFLEAFFYSQTLRGKKKALEWKEKSLFASKEVKETKERLIKEINQEGYRLGDYFSYGQAIYFAVLLALALIPTFYSGDMSLNYYLFHFFGIYAIGGALREIYSFFQNHDTMESEYDYFLEYFQKNEQ